MKVTGFLVGLLVAGALAFLIRFIKKKRYEREEKEEEEKQANLDEVRKVNVECISVSDCILINRMVRYPGLVYQDVHDEYVTNIGRAGIFSGQISRRPNGGYQKVSLEAWIKQIGQIKGAWFYYTPEGNASIATFGEKKTDFIIPSTKEILSAAKLILNEVKSVAVEEDAFEEAASKKIKDILEIGERIYRCREFSNPKSITRREEYDDFTILDKIGVMFGGVYHTDSNTFWCGIETNNISDTICRIELDKDISGKGIYRAYNQRKEKMEPDSIDLIILLNRLYDVMMQISREENIDVEVSA